MVWLVGILAVVYLALAPAVVNGDGLGYLRAAVHGGVYPGHLGYLPLIRLIPAARPVDALGAARAFSAISGALALVCFAGAARRLQLRAWLPAAFGLGCSFAVLVSASDVESYAPALLFLCAALYAMVRGWPVWAALATTGAALMHIENLLFALPLALAMRQRGFALLVPVLVALTYLLAGVTPLGATHGFAYPLHAWTPLVAIYGAAKALVYSPYLYEASLTRVLTCFVVGALFLAVLGWLAWQGGTPLGRMVTLSWLVPYGAVGLVFFASDHERWIFLLPLLWLSVAASARPRLTAAIAVGLLLANVIAWGPRTRDRSWRTRAEAATAHLQTGDLVISPGHGWDEYVGFWGGPEVRRFPLVYFAGALGGKAALEERLRREIAGAPRVVLLRLGDESDPMGWKELRLLSITPATLRLPGERIPVGDGVSYLRPSGDETRSKN